MKGLLAISCLLSFTAPLSAQAEEEPRFWIQTEVAPVWQSRNDVQIPADTGTRFSLSSLSEGPGFGFRVYLGYRLNDRNEVRALFAPLSLEVTGRFTSPVTFQDEVFGTSEDTAAYYEFNSYRLTYRYALIHDDDAWKLYIGLTGKIRDAEIRLTQGSRSASRTDFGFVPLLHFSVSRALGEKFGICLDLDGLVSPYGRAEDLALFGEYEILDRLELLAGYRTVEGGSDGGGEGNVYTFAWLHFLTLGARFYF